jgi:hypothetical protein
VAELTSYNNYTVVGDGSLNIPSLQVKIGSKKLFRALAAVKMVEGDYDPTATYTLDLSELPLVDFDQQFTDVTGAFGKLARLKAASSMISACLKDQSEDYTAEQIAELKRHYLSTSLYINFPTTNAYTNLDEALATGEVDTRLSYKVDLGTSSILNLSKLHSANKFLERMFTATVDGAAIKKPKMTVIWEGNVEFGYKKLSARTKITAVDDLMKPIFEDFLGLADTGELAKIMAWCGKEELVADLKKISQGQLGRDEAVEVLTEANRAINAAQRQLFREKISPLVFYVGATGLLPDEFGARAMSADEVTAAHPDLKIGKAEQEGTFFELGDDTLLTVYVKGEYFTPGE